MDLIPKHDIHALSFEMQVEDLEAQKAKAGMVDGRVEYYWLHCGCENSESVKSEIEEAMVLQGEQYSQQPTAGTN